MLQISANSPDLALALGSQYISTYGVREETRNGPAWAIPSAVTTTYQNPRSCVLFNPNRDANPFFHLFEAIWMMSGSNRLGPLAEVLPSTKNFSVDGETIHAAYGHRWRRHFGFDQLQYIIQKLKATPSTRQAVLSIWDAKTDLVDSPENAKDRACNTIATFTRRPNNTLDMMVSNRSNDAIWGTYGANLVHFSILHCFVAQATGMEVGVYEQVSANLHCYGPELYGEKLFNNLFIVGEGGQPRPSGSVVTGKHGEVVLTAHDHYITQRKMFLMDIVGEGDFLRESEQFISGEVFTPVSPLLRVASVMMDAYFKHKAGDTRAALNMLMGQDATLQIELDEVLYVHHAKDMANDHGELDPALQEILNRPEFSTQTSPCRIDWLHAGYMWLARRLKD